MKDFIFLKSIVPKRAPAETLLYWKFFFNFTYYTGISSFRFTWSGRSCTWELETNKAQQALSLFLQALVAWCVVVPRQSQAYWQNSGNPMFYFFLAAEVSNLSSFLVILHMNLSRSEQRDLLNVFRCVQTTSSPSDPSIIGNVAEHKKQMLFTRCICAIFMLILPLIGILQNAHDTKLSLMNLLYKKTRQIFVLDQSTLQPNPILVVFTVCLYLYNNLVIATLEFFFVLTTVFFMHSCQDFLSALDDNALDPGRVIEKHRRLREVVGALNRAFSGFSFVFTIGALPFFCDIVTTLFKAMSHFLRFRMLLYVFYTTAVVVKIAEMHKRIGDEFYGWLYSRNNYKRLPQNDLEIVLHELSVNNLGLSAGPSAPISYGLLSSIFGIILTYVVVEFQFQLSFNPIGTGNHNCNCTT